jgi:hypothetical protein
VPLGTLAGPLTGTHAYAINNNGWVTGYSNSKPFLWRPGLGMMELPPLFPDTGYITGIDINDSNVIVGHAEVNPSEQGRAIYFTLEDGMHDLNTLLDASGEAWVLEAAMSINASGQIAGTGEYNGAHMAFLLTPIPEPSALLLVPLTALFLRRARRTDINPLPIL